MTEFFTIIGWGIPALFFAVSQVFLAFLFLFMKGWDASGSDDKYIIVSSIIVAVINYFLWANCPINLSISVT